MNLTTCLKKMELVGVLAFATVDHNGAPQIRNISAIHYDRTPSISLSHVARISAESWRRTDVCRFCAIQNIRK